MKRSNLILILIVLLAVAMPALAVNEYSEFAGADSHIRGVGWAQINTKAMSGAINAGDEAPDIFILRKGDVKNFTPGYYPDGTKFNRSEDNAVEVKLLPDGIAEWVTLTPGEYVAILPDGNAGQEERRTFVVQEGTIEYVNFQGHAISTKLSTQLQAFGLKIVKATFGAEECYEQTYKTVYYEANHTEIVGNTTHKECYPAQEMPEHQISAYQLITPETPATGVPARWVCSWDDGQTMDGFCPGNWEVGHVHARINGNPSQTDFWWMGLRYHITGNMYDPAFIVTPGSPAVYDWVVTTPWTAGYCPVPDTDGLRVGATRCDLRWVITKPEECWDVDNMDGHEIVVVDDPAVPRLVIDEPGRCIGSTKDVTEIVRGEASGFRVYIPASRYEELFGDPAPTLHPKWLKVWYKLGSREGTILIPDTEDLLIDYTCGD